MNRVEERPPAKPEAERPGLTDSESQFLEPTQKLADVENLALFPD